MKDCRKLFLLFFIALLFAGCASSPAENIAATDLPSTAATISPSTAPTVSPSTAATISPGTVLTMSDDKVPVREVPLYDDIMLEENGTIEVLDISGDRVLLTICETGNEDPNGGLEGAYTEMTDIIVYDLAAREIVSQTDICDTYVFYGKLIGDDYVYTAVDSGCGLERDSGYVRRVGIAFSWEYKLTDVIASGDAVPMPYVMPSGDVAFIECRGLYYEGSDDGTIAKTLFEYMGVKVVSPDGIVKTIFTPDADRYMVYSRLLSHNDGYTFRLWTDDGYMLYAGDENSVEPLMFIDDCRAVYAWWVAADGGIMFIIGYGDNIAGITSIKNVLMKENSEIIVFENKKPYLRLTSDFNGRIAAVDMSWRQFLLTVENGTLSVNRVDLPAKPTEFYCNGDGKLYAHLNNPLLGEVGLYEILQS